MPWYIQCPFMALLLHRFRPQRPPESTEGIPSQLICACNIIKYVVRVVCNLRVMQDSEIRRRLVDQEPWAAAHGHVVARRCRRRRPSRRRLQRSRPGWGHAPRSPGGMVETGGGPLGRSPAGIDPGPGGGRGPGTITVPGKADGPRNSGYPEGGLREGRVPCACRKLALEGHWFKHHRGHRRLTLEFQARVVCETGTDRMGPPPGCW